jgi:hypothetical protein
MATEALQEILIRADFDLGSSEENTRWQAAVSLGELVGTYPKRVWPLVLKWGSSPCEDTRNAIATCVLEHLLEHHFKAVFPMVNREVSVNPLFADTFCRCWKFGQSESRGNSRKFEALQRELREQGPT